MNNPSIREHIVFVESLEFPQGELFEIGAVAVDDQAALEFIFQSHEGYGEAQDGSSVAIHPGQRSLDDELAAREQAEQERRREADNRKIDEKFKKIWPPPGYSLD